MKINNLESALNCSSLPFGAVRRGGVISPDGVLNLPYEHDSHDARDAGTSVQSTESMHRNKKRMRHIPPEQGKSCDGAVTNNKGGRNGEE